MNEISVKEDQSATLRFRPGTLGVKLSDWQRKIETTALNGATINKGEKNEKLQKYEFVFPFP